MYSRDRKANRERSQEGSKIKVAAIDDTPIKNSLQLNLNRLLIQLDCKGESPIF